MEGRGKVKRKERKGEEGKRGEWRGEEGSSGPDQVYEEIDAVGT